RNDFSLDQARAKAAFERVGGDAGAERFCQDKQITGPRICVCHHVSKVNNPSDSETVDWLRIANGMSADDCAASFSRFLITAPQNRRNCLRRNQTSRKSRDIQSREWPPSHGKNIGERISGRDLTINKWIVHNRCEEVDGLHERTMSIQTINAGIVECA